MASGRALAGGDHQVILAVEQEAQREGAVQAGEGLARGLDRGQALVHVQLGQQGDGFGIGLGFLLVSSGGQFGAQVAEVLDDAVVDHGDRPGPVRVGIGDGGRAMGGPAGVADAGLARAAGHAPAGRTG